MFLKNQKGVILIVCYLVIVLLAILASAFLMRSISEKRLVEREKDFLQAFWLAEAGIDRAIDELRSNYNWTAGVLAAPLGEGEYSVTVTQVGNKRKILATGFLPNASTPRVSRVLEAYAKMLGNIPDRFYDYVLYVAGELELKENYDIEGDIIYGDLYEVSGEGTINGTVTTDLSINPLLRLNFDDLYNISSGQNNVYDQARLEAVEEGADNFPLSFWYDQPNSIPNVVYVETDLELKGDFGTVGGYFVVAGDVLTDPEAIAGTELTGEGIVNGCIYTTGKFEVKGGEMPGITINGAVWSGQHGELKGNTTMTYNQTYMDAIEGLNISDDVQVISWREIL